MYEMSFNDARFVCSKVDGIWIKKGGKNVIILTKFFVIIISNNWWWKGNEYENILAGTYLVWLMHVHVMMLCGNCWYIQMLWPISLSWCSLCSKREFVRKVFQLLEKKDTYIDIIQSSLWSYQVEWWRSSRMERLFFVWLFSGEEKKL